MDTLQAITILTDAGYTVRLMAGDWLVTFFGRTEILNRFDLVTLAKDLAHFQRS